MRRASAKRSREDKYDGRGKTAGNAGVGSGIRNRFFGIRRRFASDTKERRKNSIHENAALEKRGKKELIIIGFGYN